MRIRNKNGFTLVEVMIAMALFVVVGTAGSMLLYSGQLSWSVTDTNIQLTENLRQILLRVSVELQESGTNSAGTLQVAVLDNIGEGGEGGSDILRFSVPICLCGMSVIDDDGEVAHWGAPLLWGQSGCNEEYVVAGNGKVDICHLPPGNPTNEQGLSVSVNAVRAHLAHGDRLGDCGDCDPDSYSNKTIEYLLDSDSQLLRRVLNSSSTVINSTVFAHNIEDFQVSFNASNSVVSLAVELLKNTIQGGSISKIANIDVLLRN